MPHTILAVIRRGVEKHTGRCLGRAIRKMKIVLVRYPFSSYQSGVIQQYVKAFEKCSIILHP